MSWSACIPLSLLWRWCLLPFFSSILLLSWCLCTDTSVYPWTRCRFTVLFVTLVVSCGDAQNAETYPYSWKTSKFRPLENTPQSIQKCSILRAKRAKLAASPQILGYCRGGELWTFSRDKDKFLRSQMPLKHLTSLPDSLKLRQGFPPQSAHAKSKCARLVRATGQECYPPCFHLLESILLNFGAT